MGRKPKLELYLLTSMVAQGLTGPWRLLSFFRLLFPFWVVMAAPGQPLLLFWLLLLSRPPPPAGAVYEDQVGKFDWWVSGCPPNARQGCPVELPAARKGCKRCCSLGRGVGARGRQLVELVKHPDGANQAWFSFWAEGGCSSELMGRANKGECL